MRRRGRHYRPLLSQKLPTYVDGNKLYILSEPIDNIKRTHWHFKNMDVILPNVFDFDIHNYSDEIIDYDRRRIGALMIKRKMIKLAQNKGDFNTYFSFTYSKDNITNYTQIDNDNIIFHLFRPITQDDKRTYEHCSIKIPKYMVQHSVSATCSLSENTITLNFFDGNIDPIMVCLSITSAPFNIDVGNFDECNKLVLEISKINYTRLFLSRI